MTSFIAELRRRNVLRVGAFYAAAAWLLVQVATQVFPFFDIPNWVVRVVVLACVLGFPAALLLAWFYEWTPQGVKRESELTAAESAARERGGRRLDRWIIAVLSLAVVALLANTFVLRRQAGAPAAPAVAAADKSIAVLPFANLSDDKSNAYFAEGIQDEILARLAKIGSLKVISRTSTAHLASSPDDLPQIARQLGVANVLEGSVQKAGNTVHINVQLINAQTDAHLWAEVYDRKLDDIFGVEGEVAKAVAEALQARLSGGEQAAMAAKPTGNAAAYDAYLRGLAFESRMYFAGHDTVRRAVDSYAEAVRLDPGFALAWAHLSIVRSYMYFNFIDRSPALQEQARQAAETALKLRPELGEAYLAAGFFRYWCLRDFDAALEQLDQARRRLPNNAEVLYATSLIQRRQDRWQDAVANLSQATVLDPRNTTYLAALAGYYTALRQYAPAHAAYERALDIAPDDTDLIAGSAGVYQDEGDLDAAGKLLDPLPMRADNPATVVAKMLQWRYRRRFDQGAQAIAVLLDQPDPALGDILSLYYGMLAEMQYFGGHRDAARESCRQSLAVVQSLRKSADTEDASMFETAAPLQVCLGNKPAGLADAQRAMELSAGDAFARADAEKALAQVQALAGERDAALATLAHSLQVPNGLPLADLRLSPYWDFLRDDPRFEKLLAGAAPAAASRP